MGYKKSDNENQSRKSKNLLTTAILKEFIFFKLPTENPLVATIFIIDSSLEGECLTFLYFTCSEK